MATVNFKTWRSRASDVLTRVNDVTLLCLCKKKKTVVGTKKLYRNNLVVEQLWREVSTELGRRFHGHPGVVSELVRIFPQLRIETMKFMEWNRSIECPANSFSIMKLKASVPREAKYFSSDESISNTAEKNQ